APEVGNPAHLDRDRTLPFELLVRDEPRHEHDVDRTVAQHLERDAQVAALRVLRLGDLPLGHRPVHRGARFSANAATPSAASSVCVVTVSIPWRYESAASASISSTR